MNSDVRRSTFAIEHPSRSLILLGALVAAAVSMSWAAVLEGDRELLKLVATAQKSNKDSIMTWTGGANVVQSVTDAQGRESRFSATVTFVSDETQQAKRWRWTFTDRSPSADGQVKTGQQDGEAINQMYRGDSFFDLRYLHDRKGRKQGQLVVQPGGEMPVNGMGTTLDPIWYLTKDGRRLADELLFNYNTADDPTLRADRSVRRSGSLVVFEKHADQIHVRYTFDLSHGGNLVLYENTWEHGKDLWEWEYQQLGEIWVPVGFHCRIENDNSNTRVLDRRVHFTKNVLNEPVDPQEFSFARLGVVPGDTVVDHKMGIAYTYEAPTTVSPGPVVTEMSATRPSEEDVAATSTQSLTRSAPDPTQKRDVPRPVASAPQVRKSATNVIWVVVVLLVLSAAVAAFVLAKGRSRTGGKSA